jgi:hypothetical protein
LPATSLDENEKLVRERGLFQTGPGVGSGNNPQFPDARFRTASFIGGLDVTTKNDFFETLLDGGAAGPFPGETLEFLGWGGDGAPDFSVVSFARGAVRQHFTNSLDRGPDDFRLPTEVEEEKLEKFQRWLGRRIAEGGGATEFPLAAGGFGPPPDPNDPPDPNILVFADARAEAGKVIFADDNVQCNVCHTNGGANLGGGAPGFLQNGNFTQEIGTDSVGVREQLEAEVGVPIPEDLGLGGTNFVGAMNVQSIIEAPRKHTFFHNGFVRGSVEDVIPFYFSPEFLASHSGAPPVLFNQHPSLADFEAEFPNGVNELGALMRSLSSFYALRDCERLIEETITRIDVGASPNLSADHCIFNLNDTREMLQGAKVTPKPYPDVIRDAPRFASAIRTALRRNDVGRLNSVLEDVAEARRSIATTALLP